MTQADEDNTRTQTRHAEASMRESDEKYRRLFESLGQGYAEIELIRDAEGHVTDLRYIAVNPALERLSGLKVSETVGRTAREAIPGIEETQFEMYEQIAAAGVPDRREYEVPALGRWYECYIYPAQHDRLFTLYEDITERKKAEALMRETKEHQAFLLRLSDMLRAEPNPDAVANLSVKLLLEQLRLDRCYITFYRPSEDEAVFPYQVGNETVPPLPPKVRLSDFPDAYDQVLERTYVIEDDFERRGLSEAERANSKALGMRAMLASTVRRGEKNPLASMVAVSSQPRRWSVGEIGLVEDTAERTWAAMERARADEVLRESEEQQAFLLRLSDELRGETNADAAALLGIGMVMDQLRLDRCYLAAYRLADDRVDITHQVGTSGVPAMPTTMRLSDFPMAFRQVFDQTLVVEDVTKTRGLSESDRQNMAALGFGSLVASTLRRGEHYPLWVLVAVSAQPRRWTGGDVTLIEDAAERIWATIERARTDTALRESEARFRQFANASSDALWIRDGKTFEFEYVSPAISSVFGVSAEAVLADAELINSLIVPEDRDATSARVARIAHGERIAHEYRIRRPSDGSFRWIRSNGFPLVEEAGTVNRIATIAADVTEAKQAVEHQAVLLAELQHRVRNIMGVIRSMARRTADGATDVPGYSHLLEGRLTALSRVQQLLTREANAGGSLRGILEAEIGAVAHGGHSVQLSGPEMVLSPKAVEVLTLAFHELATNALKYGALSVPDGTLSVSWVPFEKRASRWLAVDWVEAGAPQRQASGRRGYGSELIERRIPYELGGTGTLSITSGGATCRLEFPLAYAESILETDAPGSATIFGGSLDMTGAPDLSGRRVLVVEDDYYAASDTAAALRGAGAEVLGPCPSEEATLALLETETPTAAVVDLNLGGGGPRFNVAHALHEKEVPFVFVTGYDPDVIPDDLASIARLQKPMSLRAIVEAVARLS